MILEILAMGFGGASVVLFIAHCAGGTWSPKAQHYSEPNPVETLEEMEL